MTGYFIQIKTFNMVLSSPLNLQMYMSTCVAIFAEEEPKSSVFFRDSS